METPKLSPAKINSTKLLPGTSISTKKISTKSLQSDSNSILKNDLVIIKKQVFKIRDLIQTSTLIRQSELEKKRKSDERKKTEEKENKLEAKPEKKEEKLKMPSVPKLGFLDRIKNFIFNVLLGYFTIKLLPHLPKLVSVVSIIGNVMEFMIDLGGNILDKVVTFIDWGYKAIDATRGFLKSFGGDFTLKMFDNFTGAIEGVITATIAASIALTSLGDDSGIGDLIGDQLKRRGAQQAATSAARQAGATASQAAGSGATASRAGGLGAGAVAGIIAGVGLLASALGEGAFQVRKFGTENIKKSEDDQKNDKNPFTKFAKGVVLNLTRPLFGLFQTIGFLLDVVGAPFRYAIELLRYPFLSEKDKVKQAKNLSKFDARIREDIRKAYNMLTFGFAFKEKGSFGNIYGNKGAQKEVMAKMSDGGITRGGKIQGTVKRTIKKPKRTIKTLPSKVKPGQSVGGEKKIKNIFPEVETKDKSKKINPYGYMKSSYDKLSSTQAFGGLFALPLKAQLGEKPSSADYKVAAEGLNSWMQRTFSSEIMRTGGVGFAEGGKVEAGMFTLGEDMTKVIEKSLEESISSKVTAAINDLKRQLGLKPDEGKKGEKDKKEGEGKDDPSLDVGDGGTVTGVGTPEQQAMLAAISFAEGTSKSYGTVYGGKVIPELEKGEMTVAQVLEMQRTGSFKGIQYIPKNSYNSDATGRYQFMSYTLKDEIAKQGISKDAKFTPALQDKLILGRISTFRGVTPELLKKEGMSTRVMDMLAPEFASFPYSPKGNASYYGQPVKSPESIRSAYNKALQTGSTTHRMSGRGAVDEPSSELPSGVRGGSMRTGPSRYIGGSTEYHIDTKFHRSLGMSNMVSAMDKLANAYSARGRKIEFSNAGVAGAVWSPKASDADKKSLLQRAIDAHSHSTFMRAEGFLPFDYYNPKKNDTRFGKSVEGSEILLPTFGGKVVIGTKYGGYGKSAEIFRGDKMVAMTGHGDTRYEKGGRVNKPTFALLGEKGPEFVFDADTTAGLNELAPGLLERLNIAKTKPQLASILQSYAEYEDGGEQIVIISREMIPIPMLMQNPNLSGGMIPMSSSVNTTYDRQFANA